MKIAEQLGGGVVRKGQRAAVVSDIQRALRSAGHEVIVDGSFGHITFLAVQRFQASRILTPDGIVGPVTARALDIAAIAGPEPAHVAPAPSCLLVAPHLAVMRAMTGTAEIPGPESNPLIIGWRDSIARKFPQCAAGVRWFRNDDTAWCGLATANAVAECGFSPPAAPLWARNWLNWGVELQEAVLGAILIFSRGDGGHVTLAEAQDKTAFHCRGGNQSNTVNVTRCSRSRLLGIRWPAELPVMDHVLPWTTATGTLSTNEA